MSTALTLNANQDASSSLATADQLVSTQTGTTSGGMSTKIGTAFGVNSWGQIYAQGSIATWPALGAIGAPDGNGWLLDNTTLEGQTIAAGNWQWIEKARITAGTATIDMVVRYYKRSSAGVYTLIASITLSGQAFTTTQTVYTSASTAESAISFSTGDKLYKDMWINITANSGAGAGTSFSVQTCSNVGAGLASIAQTTTPGYSPTLLTPLTVYGSNIASTQTGMTNSGQLAPLAGGTDVSSTSKVGTSTGYGEVTALGASGAWLALGSIGAPTGNGWLLNANTLYSQQITIGVWTPIVQARITIGTATADMYIRAYAYDTANGTYTLIGTMSLTGQAFTIAQTVYTFAGTSLPAFNFNATQRLYIDCWFNVTSNSSGSSTAQFSIRLSTSASTGVANDMQVSTPGYQPANAVSTFTTYLSNQASNVQGNADQLYSIAGSPSTTTRDVVVGKSLKYGEITSQGATGSSVDSPYGVVYYFSGQHGSINLLPQKVIDCLVGGNGEAGLVPGGPIWLRPQVRWFTVEYTHTTPPTYDWSIIDDLVSRCNAANILVDFCIQIPPSWRLDLDVNGNAVTPGSGTAVYASGAATADYAKELAARYNGTTTNAIHGNAQTARTISAFQWNEDYDAIGNSTQRDQASQRFVENWQIVGPLFRQYNPNARLIGPASRATGTGLAHRTTWTNYIFTYQPAGRSWAGAIVDSHGASILDALDFHYYRDSVTNAKGQIDADPNDPIPSPSGSSVPTPAQIITAFKQVASNNGYSNFDVWCTETGWNVYTLSGTPTNVVTQAQQSQYIQETLDQHRTNGGSHVMIWALNPNSVAQLWANPQTATEIKSIVQNNQTTQGGATTFKKLQAYTDVQNTYIPNYPSWGITTAWPGSTSMAAQTGNGWLLDLSVLEGQKFLTGGTWSATLTLQSVVSGAGSGSIVGDIHVRVSKYSTTTNNYTLIANTVLAGQTITSTATAFTTTATGSLASFNTGDKLYLDIWINITTNGNNNANQAIRLLKLSLDTSGQTGDAGAELVTPGYQPQSTTPTLATSPTTLSFSALQSGSDPTAKTSTLSETGGASTAWTSNIAYGSNSGWLTISPTSGTLIANGSKTITYTCNTGALAAGTYTATVTFTASTGGSIATVNVTFVVNAVTNPVLSTSPSAMTFNTSIGGGDPAIQNTTLAETAGVGTDWTSNIAYGSNSGWLTVSPPNDTLLALSSEPVAITCTLGALTTGTYTATVTFTASTGGATAIVAVTFAISAALQPGMNVLIANQQLQIYEGSYELDDSVKQASTIQFRVRDDSGANHYTKGQPIKIVDSVNGLQYTGFTSTAVEDRESPNPLIKTDIGGRDNHYLVEKITYDGPEFTNVPAAAIFCQLLNILAQEGITAQYAADRDYTSLDFSSGALTRVVGANNTGGGDLELSLAGGVVTISEATTSQFGTGTLTGVSAANNTLAPTATSAIKLVATCTQPGSNNAYTYMKIWAGSHLVAASESFSYDIFVLPSSPSGQMGIDVLFTDGTNWRDTASVADIQYVFPHPKNDVGPMGVGSWYHRSFYWGDQYSGKTVQSVQVVCEGDAVGVYTGYFRNIQLNASPFTFSLNTIQQIGNNGYATSEVSVVSTYDLISGYANTTQTFRNTASYSIDAAKILKSSNVTWTAVEPPGTKFILKVSYDGGTIYQICTKNAPLPNLPAGANIAGKSLIFSEQFWYDPSVTGSSRPGPEVAPVLSALQVTIQPSYAATKTDITYKVAQNADWAAGTFTRTTNNSGRDLALKQTVRNWDTGDVSSQTIWGTTSPQSTADRQTFHMQFFSTATADVRSQLNFAGNVQDGIVEVDILVDNANIKSGIVYRTTNWSNANNTFAYNVDVTTTSITLGRGTNNSTGTWTQIATATLNLSSGNWHRLKVVAVGSNHKIYLDDVLYINATDGTFTATGYIGLRIYNSSGSDYTGHFDNFGVVGSGANLSGTWVSPAQSLAGAGTYGASAISWRDLSSDPGNTDTLLVETQIDGSTWQTATNGQPVPNLTAGQSLAGVSLSLRITLTTTTASTAPIIDNIVVQIISQINASGNRVSPALSLANVGRLGGSVIAWNNAPLPSGCTLAIKARIDAGAYIDVTANNGGPIPGLVAQAAPWLDMFDTDSSVNYTKTHNDGGTNTTWTWNIANKRVTNDGSGYDGCLVYNGFTFVDGYVEMDTDQVDNGGLACRRIDGNNMYLVYFGDASASDFWGGANTFQLFKLVGGTYVWLANGSIAFIRGTYHRFRLSTIGTTISVLMDGVQLASVTDSSITTAGQAGLIGNGNTSTPGRFYSIRVQPFGDDVSSHTVQIKQILTSTNPLATPQITDINVAAFGSTIGVGATIPQTSMFHKYISDCIGDLANASDYWWNIDKNKVPYFLPQNAIPSPWIASDGGSVPTSGDFLDANITVEDASDMYFNREIVDNVLAPTTINETRLGDGTRTSWTFGDQWAGAPTITITNTITGVVATATVGVKNVDTGKQFYYAVGDSTIVEDASGPLYDFTFSLNFTGPGQYLTYSQYDNTAAQAERAGIEGNGSSGIVVRQIVGTGLTKAQGDTLAQADVTQYSVLGRLVKATTRRYGLTPGQALSLFLPAHKVWNMLALIRAVKTHLTTEFPNGTAGGGIQQGWYDIEAISGPDIGDWTKMYKRPRNKPPL